MGVVATTLLTAKAAFRAGQLIHAMEQMSQEEIETKRRIELTWKLYIPAVGTGIATVGAIVAANRIGNRRAAAIAAAYSLTERAFVEYKEKVVERIGPNKETAIRDEIAQDRVNQNPASNREVIVTGNGDHLCYEAYTGRYFRSTMQALLKAQNEINYQILNHQYASLGDFYEKVGLPATIMSEEFGWHGKMLDLQLSTVLSEEDAPCIAFSYSIEPIRKYNKHN